MPKKKLVHAEKSHCPLARSLDILGDKWTLLILRDMVFFGKNRFRDLLSSPESIPTNVLSDRLKLLEINEMITKSNYTPNRYEYHLTEKGKNIKPVLLALIDWGGNYNFSEQRNNLVNKDENA